MALSTSAKFNRSKIDVATTAISVFLNNLMFAPYYKAIAVMIVLAKSHSKL